MSPGTKMDSVGGSGSKRGVLARTSLCAVPSAIEKPSYHFPTDTQKEVPLLCRSEPHGSTSACAACGADHHVERLWWGSPRRARRVWWLVATRLLCGDTHAHANSGTPGRATENTTCRTHLTHCTPHTARQASDLGPPQKHAKHPTKDTADTTHQRSHAKLLKQTRSQLQGWCFCSQSFAGVRQSTTFK